MQVLSFHTQAFIDDGAVVTSTGALTVNAAAPMGLQNLALSGGLSTGGTAVGGAIAVNVLTLQTVAYIGDRRRDLRQCDGSTRGHRLLACRIRRPGSVDHEDHVPGDLVGRARRLGGRRRCGGHRVGGRRRDLDRHRGTHCKRRPLNDTSHGGTHGGSGQTVTVSATDDTHLINVAGAVALTEGDAGVGVGIIVDVITKDVKATVGDSANVWAGGDVKVDATATEQLFELSVEAAVSTSGAGIAGGFIVVVDNGDSSHGIVASIGASIVHGLGIEVKASDTADKLELYAGNISFGDSAGVGVATVVLVRNGIVNASVATGASLDRRCGRDHGLCDAERESDPRRGCRGGRW